MNGKRVSWIINTGALNHMTRTLNLLHDLRDIMPCIVRLPNGNNAVATKDHTLRTLIGVGERRDELYYFKGTPRIWAFKIDKVASLDLWHQRLGHSFKHVIKLIPAVSFEKNNVELNKCCDVCQREKQTREKFPVCTFRAYDLFELIHCDLWGPYRHVSFCGASYFLTTVDDYSRAVWIYLLTDKKVVSQTMKMFFSMVVRQFNKQVKIVRSDNGAKFTCLKHYFLENGIIFQTSCTGTPQQNERVESKHQH